MFTANNNKQRYFGGTAENIAYGFGLLEESPLLFSVVGKDFQGEYSDHLNKHGVDTRVITDHDGYTGTFYGISDQSKQQIDIWQPNSYGKLIEKSKISSKLMIRDFEEVSVAIFSPEAGISTRNHMKEARDTLGSDLTIIFDPGQVLSIFYDDDMIRECLDLADIVISNRTEINQFQTNYNLSKQSILKLGINYVIETEGADGSVVSSEDEVFKITAIEPEKVVETTGSGDEYRAGLIYGLLNGIPIDRSAKIGALLGSKSVAELGAQSYFIDKNEISNLS